MPFEVARRRFTLSYKSMNSLWSEVCFQNDFLRHIGNVVQDDVPRIKNTYKRPVQAIFNMAEAVILKANFTPETIHAFVTQSESPSCNLEWHQVILAPALLRIRLRLQNVSYHTVVLPADRPSWPVKADGTIS